MIRIAQKTGDRNLFFSEGKEIYCEPVILLDPPIAPFLTANGTFETYNSGKMDASLNKGFFVFPDIGVCVIKWQLYFSIKKEDNICRGGLLLSSQSNYRCIFPTYIF